MIPYEMIESHYVENRQRYMKWLAYKAGSEQNADDIIQEAYYRSLKYASSCRPEEVGYWIGRIIYRCLIDFMNDLNGRITDEEIAEDSIVADCPSYPLHIMREVFELIDTKSKVQIEVLTMYFKYEYSAMDISKITEYSYAQCHKIISRFREELVELYQ